MIIQEFKICREKNINLNVLTHKLDNPKIILIHLHGLHSTFQDNKDCTENFRNRAMFFQKKNIKSYGLEFYGHGKSDGRKAYVENLDIFLKDLECLVNYVNNYENLKEKHIPIYLLGESMGGAIAIKYSYYFKNIDGVILLSPLIKLNNLPNKLICNLLVLLSYIFPSFDISNFFKINNETGNKFYDDYDVNNPYSYFYKYSLCSVRECYLFYNWVKDKNLNIPILIFNSINDGIVEHKQTELFFNRSTSNNKKMITFMHNKHKLLIPFDSNDKEPQTILNYILNWIK